MSKANENSNAVKTSLAMNTEDKDDVTASTINNQVLSLAEIGHVSDVQRRVMALQEIQIKLDEYEIEYIVEKAALEAKYQKCYQQLYEIRYDVVSGAIDVEGDGTNKTMAIEGDEEKGVPAFWLVAMKNNKVLAEEISESDEAALAFLRDIHWSKVEPESFKIDFFFESSNPFFSNPVLTKTYHMVGQDFLLKTSSSVIEWYPGKSLTENTTRRKKATADLLAKNKKSDDKCFSFFNFFSSLVHVDGGHDAAEETNQLMNRDYIVGITIKDEIIPHAVYWYTGEAVEDDNYSSDDSDEDEYEDEDEDYNIDGERLI